MSQSIPLASLEIRDAVFRELLKLSPASNYREELVTGPSGLLSRGLLEQHTTSYGALPPTNQQRAILARILNDYVRASFPEHAESHSGAGIVGVPGFWQELSGMVQLLVGARRYVLAMGISLVACVTPLFAQQRQQLDRPKVEGKVIFGSAVFGEDLEHTLVGGSVRAYVTKRVSLEPEYLYLRRSEDDQDHLVEMNVAYDFTDPTKRFVPYVIGGAGVLHNRGRVFRNDFVTGAPFVREITFTTWSNDNEKIMLFAPAER